MKASRETQLDMEYCYKVIKQLWQLEQNHYQRNEVEREIERCVRSRMNRRAVIVGLILPFLLLLYFILAVSGNLVGVDLRHSWTIIMPRLIGLIFVCAIIFVNLFLLSLHIGNKYRWDKEEKRWRERLAYKEDQITLLSKKLFDQRLLTSGRVADNHMNINDMLMILDYMEKRQAGFLEEAIYMMELNRKSDLYTTYVEDKQNIFQKERQYVQQYSKSI